MHLGYNFLRSMISNRRGIARLIHTTSHSSITQKDQKDDHARHDENAEQFNEPSGILFGIPEGGRLRDVMSPLTWIFLVGFLGSTALFIGLWQYRPDTSAEAWAKRTALRRMRERGVDMSYYIDD